MWWMADAITKVEAQSFGYNLDTAGGQSGAPAFIYFPDRGRIGVGVHTYGSRVGQLRDAADRRRPAQRQRVEGRGHLSP